MKSIIKNSIVISILAILGIMWIFDDLSAQQGMGRGSVIEQLRDMNIEIPFVDKDGDGINDLMQNGWGLRFLNQYRNRRALWNQLMTGDENSTMMIDTDGDGTPDTQLGEFFRQGMNQQIDTDGDGLPDISFGEHMRGLMNQLIDTDGDGTPDTPLRDYMRRNFQLFDQDGDGVPDQLTPDQIRENFQNMREWRQQIRNNIMNGLPPFIDADGDGIPDNLPAGFGWMRGRHGMGGGGGKPGGQGGGL